MQEDKTFKDVLLVENPVTVQLQEDKEYTWEELQEEFARVRWGLEANGKRDHNAAEEQFWAEFDVNIFSLTNELKERFYFEGLMDLMTYSDILRVFQKNVFVEKIINSDEEDNNSNEDDEEVVIV